MGINFDNDYGITRKEWKSLKKEIKAEAKQNEQIDFKRSDIKEIKKAIKSGNLGDYLDKLAADNKLDMLNAMGLKLTGKVDGTEDIEGAKRILEQVQLGPTSDGKPVDKAKVLQYILSANTKQIAEGFQQGASNFEYADTISHLETSKGLFAEAFLA